MDGNNGSVLSDTDIASVVLTSHHGSFTTCVCLVPEVTIAKKLKT